MISRKHWSSDNVSGRAEPRRGQGRLAPRHRFGHGATRKHAIRALGRRRHLALQEDIKDKDRKQDISDVVTKLRLQRELRPYGLIETERE